MKSIPLKTMEADLDGQKLKLSYKAQLAEILRVPSDGRSADLNEVRHSLRIIDALEATTGDVLSLEDADFEYLRGRVSNARWPVINRYILEFVEDVMNAKGEAHGK